MLRLLRFLYSFLIYLSIPFVLLRMLYKAKCQPDYAQRWAERFGFYPAKIVSAPNGSEYQVKAKLIWLHACSVGEVESILGLIHGLADRYPGYQLLITTTTPAGSKRIVEELSGKVIHVYLPFDAPDAVSRFIARFNPELGLITEKEIWPNLFLQCAAVKIPLLLISACLSERSCRRYMQFTSLFQPVFQSVTIVGAQTDVDQQRFIQCGILAEKVSITGNLKTDYQLSDAQHCKAQQLRTQLFGRRPVWIAGSTHAGEEELVLAVHQQLRKRYPDLLLILAPRHPHRLPEILELCKGLSLRCQTRSSSLVCELEAAVFLLDTIGELRLFYGCADLAFVGGSLVSVGGHNLIEPLLWGLPVLFGLHVASCQGMAELLMSEGVGFQLNNADELGLKLAQLLGDAAARQQINEHASDVVSQMQQGALGHTIKLLHRVISV